MRATLCEYARKVVSHTQCKQVRSIVDFANAKSFLGKDFVGKQDFEKGRYWCGGENCNKVAFRWGEAELGTKHIVSIFGDFHKKNPRLSLAKCRRIFSQKMRRLVF